MMLKKYTIKGFLLLFFIAFIFCTGQAQRKLVIQGSSTAACAGSSSYSTCWVGFLDNYYDTQKPTDVVAVAHYGWSVYEGMPSSYINPSDRPAPDADYNITKSLSFAPDVIIVNYPSNGYNTYTVTEVMARLRTIYDSATRYGKPCYITTPQPRSDAAYNNSLTKKNMWEIKDSVMAEFGYFALNFWDGLINPIDTTIYAQYNYGDNIHLNDAGHAYIANQVIAKDIFNVALPLNSLNFTAIIKNKKVLLQWNYNDDVKITAWQLQKSNDGMHFSSLYETSSAGKKQFEFTDEHPDNGNNFYRLQFTLSNGTKEFSSIKKVIITDGVLAVVQKKISSAGIWLRIYSPIPQMASVQLINTSGSNMQNQQIFFRHGDNEFVMPVNGFQNNSIAILHIQSGSETVVQKLSLH